MDGLHIWKPSISFPTYEEDARDTMREYVRDDAHRYEAFTYAAAELLAEDVTKEIGRDLDTNPETVVEWACEELGVA